MNFVYIFSIIYLMISFLFYKKNSNKISLISSIIYTICLLFCYNTLLVYICSLFNIGGSLLVYSLINIGIGTVINFISFKNKEKQQYYFDKKELFCISFIAIVIFIIGMIRFSGFTNISYESADSSVHYRHALFFKDNLEILDKNNSLDLVYGDFSGVMPISYVNCGFLMKILDNVSTYRLFMFFDVFCLIIGSLLFFVTIFNVFNKKKYFYCLILSLLYLLGFPLNNFLFGFCYLGLGVMVINLLIFSVSKIKNFNGNLYLNLIILFMISFSVFFSYYLFMPCIYLGLGIYYIYLRRKGKIKLRELVIYCGITLIIPFIMGMIKFVLPGFMDAGTSVITMVGMKGYIYDNKSSSYFFLVMSLFLLITCYVKRKKIDYYWINYFVISVFIILFYILYKIDIVSLYYFYKLFYLGWFLVVIFIGNLFIKRREFFYTIFIFVIIGMGIVLMIPDNLFSSFLVKNSIFSWNASSFVEDKIILNSNELDLINESVKYNDLCVVNNQFLISGEKIKNPWIYSITDNVPLYDWENGISSHLGNENIRFDFWQDLNDYKCLIYFYEGDRKNIDESKLDILYSNDEGVILIKK